MWSCWVCAQGYLACLLFAWSVDAGIGRLVRQASTRWFLLHAICNVSIAWASASDVLACITDHSASSLPAASGHPLRMATVVHAYHAIAFHLRPEDWFHHLFFVVPSALAGCYHNTKGFQVCIFFCCGAPGAVDYLALAGSKAGLISPTLRRRLYGFTSVCVRAPGAVLGSSLLIQDGLKYRGAGCATVGALVLLNGVYYGHQAAWAAGYHAQDLKAVKEKGRGVPTGDGSRPDA